MTKLLSFFTAIILLSNCTVSSEPDFVKMDDYKILKLNRQEVHLGTNAYFFNPNDVGCEVVKTEVKVLVNGLHVSDVNQTKVIELDANNEFYIPMKVSIPLEKISKDKNGILGGLAATLIQKNISVEYDGFVTLRKAGIEFDIEIVGKEMLKDFKKN